jgi:L,D-peptidoglycan transpeptidase YkuD (ErfK/YbiS/YcfS/YnhG family)
VPARRRTRAALAAGALALALAGCAEPGDLGDPGDPAGPIGAGRVERPGGDQPAVAGLGAGPTPSPTRRAKPAPTRAPTAPKRPDNAASRLRTLPSTTRQVVVVQSAGFGTSTATLQAFAKRDGAWTPAFPAMPARLGVTGFRDVKVEGDLASPTGVYGFGATMYGIAANPGVRYPYHRLVPDDWWNENPDSSGYNAFHHGADPGGASEAMWETDPQYRHLAVITYNIPVRPADPPRGSGIFLHVMVPGRATAGCVSLAEADLVKVLRWLDPLAAPRIVLAPAAELDRY